jgi:enamine deaminase RidA (YjgF/YER057c/UK114 family)
MWSSRPGRGGSSSFPASSASTSTARSSARPVIFAQAEQVFVNLKNALAAVGAGFEHVVKLNNYFVDISHLGVFREVRDRFVNTAAPPASTAVAISALARPRALIQVEAIAVVPAGAAARTAKAKGPARRGKPAAKPKAKAKAKATAKATASRKRR